MTVAKCGCTPGTYENGWMEKRSQACLDAEMKAWALMLRNYDTVCTLDQRYSAGVS